MSDIVTVFKFGQPPQRIHSVDRAGWLGNGWSTDREQLNVEQSQQTVEVEPEQPIQVSETLLDQPSTIPSRRRRPEVNEPKTEA